MLARTEATLVVQSSKLGSNDKSDGEHSRSKGQFPLTSALSTPVFSIASTPGAWYSLFPLGLAITNSEALAAIDILPGDFAYVLQRSMSQNPTRIIDANKAVEK